MTKILLIPPVTFIIVFFTSWLLLKLFSRLSFRISDEPEAGSRKAYACGEDNYCNTARPDYSSFFRFAFFFTLAHVAALIITTVPLENIRIFFLALIYIEAVIISLFILFKK